MTEAVQKNQDVLDVGEVPPSRKLTVALMPYTLPVNKFVDLFSDSIHKAGNDTREFTWSGTGLWTSDIAILHWPNQFFLKRKLIGTLQSYAKLVMLRMARLFKGSRIIWVAHNVVPHDSASIDAAMRDRFFSLLDGVIFLSGRSKQLIEQEYPQLRLKPQLVTVHGHYKELALSLATGYLQPIGPAQLSYVGIIRPYKNLEALVKAAAAAPDLLKLRISGRTEEADALLAELRLLSAHAAHVIMDVRKTPLDDAEVEKLIDASNGLVLPYRNILNSGSALHALSRNRPVLAPRIGSLPELQDRVGERWLQLYDGELTTNILLNFVEHLGTIDAGATTPLDAYDWLPIGKEINCFLNQIILRKAGKV